MRKSTRSGASGGTSTSANATSTSVDSCPSGFSQNEWKSCRPGRAETPPTILSTARASLTQKTNGFPNAVRRLENR
jgi:hypothetical protein